MEQGTCGDPPYVWTASLTNNDTSAMTFTFQNEQEQIVEPGVYNEGANAFLIDLALWSHNYFGVADFTLTLSNADGPFCGYGGQIVTDDDNDLIADAWENAHGGIERPMTRPLEGCSGPSDACYDDDGIGNSLLGEGKIGDGISKLDEYRGIFLGPGNTGHTRLDLDSQDVFVDVDLGYTNDANWALGQLRTQLGMKVRLIDDLNALLQGAALPWAGSGSFGVFILLNDSTESTRYSPVTEEEYYERENGEFVQNGVFRWGDVPWNHHGCVDLTFGCQPEDIISGGPLYGLMNDRIGQFVHVLVASVYTNAFDALFDHA